MRLRYCLLFVFFLCVSLSARADELIVSAAASMTDVLQEIGKQFSKSSPETNIKFNFASSGALQQQIEQGAPVDVFISAAKKQMEALQSKHLIDTTTRRNIVGADLVLITVNGNGVVHGWQDLTSPSVHHIAISDPASVPSGEYTKEVFTAMGLWETLYPKFILGENVRQTLTYVESGNVEAGVVFKPDALIAKNSLIVATAPSTTHAPIVYPAAVVLSSSHHDLAAQFVDYLASDEAQKIFQKYGFTLPQ
ncbi:MAG TPA: molybdate ABC transporter substrate-binding protein [Candidatus Kapabacteria bacterium]|nr:molybdate ABC transporter substrate-binding protein [Candidatus Kapabacteria bacterium]